MRGAAKSKGVQNFHTLPGKTRDKIAAFAGISGRQVSKIKVVCEATKTDPRLQRLIEEMDEHGVNRAFRSPWRIREEDRVRSLQPRAEKFKTLIVDPPWQYNESDGLLARNGTPYPTMTREQILALPVAEWAEDNAHLYLWSCNAILPFALRCMETWGFEYKTTLTWVKRKIGMGAYFRSTTDLFCSAFVGD
jgi:hypothetical protein